MNAPSSMDALADVARALGFDLRRAEHAVPEGVDYDRAKEQTQFTLSRGGQIEFDGTARECSAFLIGWRTLRTRMLAEMHVVDAQPVPDMSAQTMCQARDERGQRCLLRAGHERHGLHHSTLLRWQEER